MTIMEANARIQGKPEWLALRKKHITATDANIIMGVSPWKTKLELYNEKKSDLPPTPPNERMQRGLDLESVARDYFTAITGIILLPKDDPRNVVFHKDYPWMMASLDGISECGQYTLEVKCPGQKDHEIALKEKIPEHYYPQNQHQIACARPKQHFYLSYTGSDNVLLKIAPEEDYIQKMIHEEKKFYDLLINNTPPDISQDDFIYRDDDIWFDASERWKILNKQLKDLEKEEEEARNRLIQISNSINTKGCGISLSQVTRKGNIQYEKVEALKNIDLEKYRKPVSVSWRITWNS
jgi:putative phage-type endonuclease